MRGLPWKCWRLSARPFCKLLHLRGRLNLQRRLTQVTSSCTPTATPWRRSPSSCLPPRLHRHPSGLTQATCCSRTDDGRSCSLRGPNCRPKTSARSRDCLQQIGRNSTRRHESRSRPRPRICAKPTMPSWLRTESGTRRLPRKPVAAPKRRVLRLPLPNARRPRPSREDLRTRQATWRRRTTTLALMTDRRAEARAGRRAMLHPERGGALGCETRLWQHWQVL
mmetsp:Transcript_60603/g.173789  ORF Transcript_60603/g.173789 Transcript_60603/m.173789 type:complete len:223 (+) Transcript_60603:133-801(+)